MSDVSNERICVKCGRRGVQQFISASQNGAPATMGEAWICSNENACRGRIQLRMPIGRLREKEAMPR